MCFSLWSWPLISNLLSCSFLGLSPTRVVSLILLFLILSNFATPHIHLGILISNVFSCTFSSLPVSNPPGYVIDDLTRVAGTTCSILNLIILAITSSSSSRSHLILWSLRQTQLSSSLLLSRTSSSVDSIPRKSLFSPSSLLWSSSSSSSSSPPRWYHLQCLSSDVVLVSYLHTSEPPQSRFPAPLLDVLYLQSLADVIISHMVSQCAAACLCTHL